MAFVKGKSGNPGGRTPLVTKDGKTITELARGKTEGAINTLVAIMEDHNASAAARVSAASTLLDRGWGRAKQEIDLDHKLTHEQATISEALGWIKDASGKGKQASE